MAGAAFNLAQVVASQVPKRSRRRRRPKTLRPVAPRATDGMQYRKDLEGLARLVHKRTVEVIGPLLQALEPQFLRDSAADDLAAAFKGLREEFVSLETFAQAKASGHIDRMDKAHSIRFFKQLQREVGIDLKGVLNREGLDEILKQQVHQNVELIQSIPVEHFGKLERMVYSSTVTGTTTAKSMIKQLMELGAKTEARARFIARDQTAKLNSAINTERNQSMGIEEYEWRATGGKSGDGRTRKNHREKHGNIYRFDSPPADTGHPGEDFQCRCTARSIIPVV